MCNMQGYSNVDDLESAINAIELALNSPYNSDDYIRDKRKKASHVIISFFKAATTIKNTGISVVHQQKLEELLSKQFY